MRTYFVDTWFVIATFDRYDPAHRAAQRLEATLGGDLLVSHDGVLTEFLAFVSNYGGVHRAAAVKLVRNAISRWKILPADRSLFMDGLDFYGERVDKSYSLVDCMSMVLMKQRGIQHVLTNDHHFTQERFTVINQ